MKPIALILGYFLLPFAMIGQYINPGCGELSIEKIEMDNDTANLVKITVFNSCTNCTQFGCVYVELRIIRTIAPYDTMASSKCMCLISPGNNQNRTYGIHASFSALPSISQLRVSFICGTGEGCDSLSFKIALGIFASPYSPVVNLFPNPVKDQVTIHTNITNELTVRVTDLAGHILISKKTEPGTNSVDLSMLEKGLYMIEVLDQSYNLIKTFKTVKD